MYEEENSWFPELKRDYDDQTFLTRRYHEEFQRYAGGADGSGARETAPSQSEPRSFAPEEGQARPLA
jgi:hypothetical protein